MFKVGDKVVGVGEYDGINIDGIAGTVKATSADRYPNEYAVEFDTHIGGHSLELAQVSCKDGYGWFVNTEHLKLLQPKFKAGDKVVPVSKSYYRTLERSVWTTGKKQGFLYVNKISIENNKLYYTCNYSPNTNGDFFLESDLVPYAESEQRPQNYAPDKRVRTGLYNFGENYRSTVIHHNQAIIYIINDKYKGVAKCSPNDKWDEKTGEKIAANRAMIKKLQAELKELTGKEGKKQLNKTYKKL